MLFIDSWPYRWPPLRVAFSSERSVKFHYKTSIPLRKIKRANESEDMTKPSQKYMEIVTVDTFDFWFMGFLNYQKAFNCLQQAPSKSQM
ncbi:hypothetical protein PVL29_013755 [Vitis rotundifolia]|uniref:GRAM domain-containing protein n=1 Tax=Vitis rotundifolia TaxID=103349 RepID=A0AA39DPR2_VITRO|nr:hypothetical protein PVL29_013755 [Vitis rotundifolia]